MNDAMLLTDPMEHTHSTERNHQNTDGGQPVKDPVCGMDVVSRKEQPGWSTTRVAPITFAVGDVPRDFVRIRLGFWRTRT